MRGRLRRLARSGSSVPVKTQPLRASQRTQPDRARTTRGGDGRTLFSSLRDLPSAVASLGPCCSPSTPRPRRSPSRSRTASACWPSATTVDARRHGELLAPAIEAVLRDAGVDRRELTRIGVGVGPGPFTGLRVGLVTARTLGAVLGVPVLGVCSLDVLALGAGLTGEFRVVTDARRREVHWAAYDGSDPARPVRTDGPYVEAPADCGVRRTGGRRRRPPLPRRRSPAIASRCIPVAPTWPAGSRAACRPRRPTRCTCVGRTSPSRARASRCCDASTVRAPMRWWDVEGAHALETCAVPRPVVGRDVLVRAGPRAGDAALPGGRDGAASCVGYAGLSATAATRPGRRADPRGRAAPRRGRASARRLLDALLAEARRRGATEVLLEVRAENAPAQALYAAGRLRADRCASRLLPARAAPTPMCCGCALGAEHCIGSAVVSPRIALATAAEFPDLDDDGPALLAALAARASTPSRRSGPTPASTGRRTTSSSCAARGTTTSGATSSWLGRPGGRATHRLPTPSTCSPGTPTRPTCARLHEAGPAGRTHRRGSTRATPSRCRFDGSGEYVVKPAVSAGSKDTNRYRVGDHDDLAVGHARELLDAGRTVMVQPYLDAVDTARRDRAAVLRRRASATRSARARCSTTAMEPVLGAYKEETIEVREPTAAERHDRRAGARRARRRSRRRLAATCSTARVDLVPGPDGAPVLLELELTEPSMFLVHDGGERHVGRRSGSPPRSLRRWADSGGRRAARPRDRDVLRRDRRRHRARSHAAGRRGAPAASTSTHGSAAWCPRSPAGRTSRRWCRRSSAPAPTRASGSPTSTRSR